MKNCGWKVFKALKFYFIADMLMTLFVYFTPAEHDAIIFFDYMNSRHPNIRFTMKKEAHHKLPFLDVLVDNNNPNSFLTRVYRKKTFTGLLTIIISVSPRTPIKGVSSGLLLTGPIRLTTPGWGYTKTLLSLWKS